MSRGTPRRPDPPPAGLRVLAVDDERPALEELAYLLGQDERIATVLTAGDGTAALATLDQQDVDALFLDIRMPGLDGVALARVLSRFATPPKIVFVSAYDMYAVAAFDLDAVDYLMKPIRARRLAEAVRRVEAAVAEGPRGPPAAVPGPVAGPNGTGSERDPAGDEVIPVELGGVTRFINRSDVRYVEAQGDYARLHTAAGSHLVRIALATLEEQWREAGFVRIHRRHLVAVRHIDELHVDIGRCSLRVGGAELMVSRRHTRELRDLLVRQARPGAAR